MSTLPSLDTIDSTLDGLCACGCGASLESSPSAWYATAACQSRHQSRRHATDPGAVYRRRDAATVWVSEEGDPGDEPGPDAAPVPLSEPRPVLDFAERCGHTLSPWHREVLASLYAAWYALLDAEADRLVSGGGESGGPRGILADAAIRSGGPRGRHSRRAALADSWSYRDQRPGRHVGQRGRRPTP